MSIYSISNYAAGTAYYIHDIVRHPSNTNNYYYSLIDGGHTGNTPSATSTAWGGVSSWNGILKPKFIWRHNYGTTVQHEPMTLDVKFEGGYSQRLIQSINNDLLKLQLVFDLRTERETQAIIHFLYARRSFESFLFTASPPHDLEKLYICKNWNDSYRFYNNHEISCIFDEVAA